MVIVCALVFIDRIIVINEACYRDVPLSQEVPSGRPVREILRVFNFFQLECATCCCVVNVKISQLMKLDFHKVA